MRRWIATLALGTALAGNLFAGDLGSQSALWTRIPTDIRSAAMGSALVALSDDTGALALNPAGLGLEKNAQLSLSHSFWAQDVSLEHAAIGENLGGVGFAF